MEARWPAFGLAQTAVSQSNGGFDQARACLTMLRAVLLKLGPRGQTIMLTVVTVAVLSMLIYAVQHGEWILFACVAGWIACVRLAWHRRHTEAVTD